MKLLIPLIRTALVCGALVLAAVLTLRAFTEHELRQANEELVRLNQEMQQRVEEREQMIERLSTSRRLAHVKVEKQTRNTSGRIVETQFRFIELDERGAELASQDITLPGEVVYIDAWTVKFAHDDVAQGLPMTGRTLVLLRRIYSDQIAPAEGPMIDTPGAVPPAYAVSDEGRFEQRLWTQFWRIASDPELAASMNVRVAQGEAVYKRVRAGQTYELIVDAAGGMSLTPVVTDIALSFADDDTPPAN